MHVTEEYILCKVSDQVVMVNKLYKAINYIKDRYNNKPGTAKVGPISKSKKAQNCKRGVSLGFVKLQLVAI